MDYLEIDGIRYSRYGKKWADPNGMIVSEIMQDKLNRKFGETLNYEQMTPDDLIKTGDQYKASQSLGLALKCYTKAFEKATLYDIGGILPRLTSLYRQMGKPQNAIDILTEASKKYGKNVISAPLLISGAAAYCDLKNYGLAKKCCDRAFALCGGKASGELQAVYGRIRKEAPEEVE